jgi:hypothetical protein
MLRIFLAGALLLSGCNAPPPHPAKTLQEVERNIDVADTAIVLVQRIGGKASSEDIQAAVQEMVAALAAADSVGTQINRADSPIRRIDAKAAAEVSGCTEASTLNFVGLQRYSEQFILQRRARDATRCATLAQEYLRVVASKDIADDIGFTIGMIYPIALAAHAQAGFSTGALLDSYRSANETIIAKLEPQCREWRVRDPATQAMEMHYECVAYNGARAQGKNRDAVNAQATQLTSRGVAMAVVPKLEMWARSPASRTRVATIKTGLL